MWHGRNVAHVVGWPLVQAKALAASGALQDRFHTLPVAAEFLNDLHAYDLNGTTWTDLSAAASGTPPSARCAHGLASVEGKLYVHGGESDSGEGDGLHGRGRERPGLLRPACLFPSPNGNIYFRASGSTHFFVESAAFAEIRETATAARCDRGRSAAIAPRLRPAITIAPRLRLRTDSPRARDA